MSFFATPNTALIEYITYHLLPRCFSIVLQSLLLPSGSPATLQLARYYTVNTIAKMSDSSLSPPPRSDINLPTLPPLSPTLQLRRTAKKPGLASTDSDLFTSSLFSRTLLETTPPTMQLRCLQPGCLYAPKPQLLSFNQTGNY